MIVYYCAGASYLASCCRVLLVSHQRSRDLDAEAGIPDGEVVVLGGEHQLLGVLHHGVHGAFLEHGAPTQLGDFQRAKHVRGIDARRQPRLAGPPQERHVVLVAGDQERVQLALLQRRQAVLVLVLEGAGVEEGEEEGELVVVEVREGDGVAGGGLAPLVVGGQHVPEHLRPRGLRQNVSWAWFEMRA
jgi:hypothetical protein